MAEAAYTPGLRPTFGSSARPIGTVVLDDPLVLHQQWYLHVAPVHGLHDGETGACQRSII
jgi:hypothetical protein